MARNAIPISTADKVKVTPIRQKRVLGNLASPQRSPPDRVGEAAPPLPIELDDTAQPRLMGGSNSETKPIRSQPDAEVGEGRDGGKILDIWDESVGQGNSTGTREADEATQGLEAVRGDVEHASATPMRQKRFFKDLSPLPISPPDSGDGAISPLQGGSEGRHLSMLPSVFDSSGKEPAARDLDVEAAGVSEEGGRLPDIEVAHVGQGDGEREMVSSETITVLDGGAGGMPTAMNRRLPDDWATMSKSQRNRWSRRQNK